MTDIKIVLGSLAAIIGLLGYVPYLKDVLQNRTKPHTFSWLIWTTGMGTAFFAQVIGGGGAGSWAMGTTTLCSACILVLSLWKGHKNITTSDFLALAISLIAIALWWKTNDPVLSVILVGTADLVAFFPTIRKSYWNPWQETLAHYLMDILQLTLALLALESYSIITWFYPATILVGCLIFTCVVLARRKQLPPV